MNTKKNNLLSRMLAWLTAFAMIVCLQPANLWEVEAATTRMEVESDKRYYDDVFQQYYEALDNNLYIDVLNGESDDWDSIGDYVSVELLSSARYYKNYGSLTSEENFYIFYSIYDINKDGIGELFIGDGSDKESAGISDVFTYSDNQISPLFPVGSFGYRSNIILSDEDDTFYVVGSGGASYHIISHYCLPEFAHSPKLIGEYTAIDSNYSYTDSDGIQSTISESEYMSVHNTVYSYDRIIDWTLLDDEEIEGLDVSIVDAVRPYARQDSLLNSKASYILSQDISNETKQHFLYELFVNEGFTDEMEGLTYLMTAVPAQRAYKTLMQNELYTSYNFVYDLNNTTKGKVSKGLLYADGLIFNNEISEWIDPTTYMENEYPGVKKYKAMLEEFIAGTAGNDGIEALEYAEQGSKILNNVIMTYNIVVDDSASYQRLLNKFMDCESEEEAKKIMDKLLNDYIRPSIGTDSIIVKSDILAEAAGHANKAFKITNYAVEDISNFINLSSKLNAYEQYREFLVTVQASEDLPVELRLAAYQILDDMEKKYWAAIEDVLYDCVQLAGDELNLDKVLFGQLAAEALGTISLASFIVNNVAADMGTFVKEAGQTEGYVYLSALYTILLEESRQNFLAEETEENAWDFYNKYVLLYKLRIAAEESYLAMNDISGIMGHLAKMGNNFEEKKEHVQFTIERLKSLCKFTLHDGTSSMEPVQYAQKAVVKCPVGVAVYDASGNLVAEIQNGKESDISNAHGRFVSLYQPLTKDYAKIIYLLSDEPYEIRMTAENSGTVSYTYYNGGESAYRFKNVPVKKGSVIRTSTDVQSDGSYQADYDGNGTYEKIKDLEENTVGEIKDITSLSLSEKDVSLYVGESKALDYTFAPAEAQTPQCTWSSSDRSIAEVQNGVVTAKKSGTVQITCTSTADDENGEAIYDICNVTVQAKKQENEPTGGGNVQLGNGGDQSKDTRTDMPAKNPENLKKAMVMISGLKFYVDTKTDRTAAIIGIAKNNKKTIPIKDTVTVKGVKYKVTTINSKAFKNCRKVTKIIIPASVKLIKKNAFTGAKKLKQIVFKGKKAISIKKGAFKGLNTKKMTAIFNKKMTKKEFAKMKKTLKKAGFKGKVKK